MRLGPSFMLPYSAQGGTSLRRWCSALEQRWAPPVQLKLCVGKLQRPLQLGTLKCSQSLGDFHKKGLVIVPVPKIRDV